MKNTTKKNLTWKLSELPTAGELADLVDSEVISKEEAREIMFGSAENDKEVIKTLQDQLEFLQDLVKELSKRNTTTYLPTFTREIHVTRPYYEKYWMNTNKVLGDAGYTLTAGSVTTTSGTSGSTFYSAGSTSGSLNSSPAVMSVSLSQRMDGDATSKVVS